MSMDTTTTEQGFAVLEMWSTKLTQYVSAIGLVVVLYDYLLTMKDEVRLVWPGGLNLPKALYYINRYLTATSMLFCTYEVAAFRPALSKHLSVCFTSRDSACSPDLSCQVWIFVSGISVVIATTSSTILLTLRVTALYRNVRWVVWLLWLALALFQGLRVAVLLFGDVVISESIIYSPISNICIVGSTSYRPTALIGVPTLFDLLLLVLTAFKAWRSPVLLRANSILRTLVRDEVLFFAIISTLRITNAAVWLFLPPWWVGIVFYAEWGLDSVFATRFFLNLRSIVYHQRTSIFGDYATPIDPSASRTGPFRNQLGRPLASMFLDLGMDKTVCSSGTNPNNGDIEQADIIDLEVIELQEYQLQR